MLSVFDIGFSFNLAHRWQTIDALRTHIDRITAQVTNEDRTDASVADIRSRAEAKSGNLAIKRAIDQTRARLKEATVTAVAKIGQGYEPNIEERLTTMNDMSTWIRCGVLHVYDGRLTNTFYGVNAVGNELVISELIERAGSGNVVVGRIPLSAPATFPELETIVEQRIIENVHRTIEGS